MKYSEFCASLGLEKITPEAEAVYNKAKDEGELDKAPCTELLEWIFTDTYEEVLAAARYISENKLAKALMNFLRVGYYAGINEYYDFPEHKEGDIASNLAPLFALLAYASEANDKMLARGMSEETRKRTLGALERAILASKKSFGYLAMRSVNYFWSRHYLAPDLFAVGELEFEITGLPEGETVLVSKESGDIVALRELSETEADYSGKTVLRGGDDGECIVLSKKDYEILLSPGDELLSVHIPKGAKVDRENADKTYREALEFFARHYPEKKFTCFWCRSWLMDPSMEEFLPEKSNILAFQSFYKRYCVKSTGKEVFVFVHPQPFEKYEDLPENTTLERALKKRYIENKPIYVHAGVHIIGEKGKTI